jgi:hypothetical protein
MRSLLTSGVTDGTRNCAGGNWPINEVNFSDAPFHRIATEFAVRKLTATAARRGDPTDQLARFIELPVPGGEQHGEPVIDAMGPAREELGPGSNSTDNAVSKTVGPNHATDVNAIENSAE